MRFIILLVAAGISSCTAIFLYACAGHAAKYDIHLHADTADNLRLSEKKRVMVYTKKETRNLILEMETAEKINKALSAYGYKPVENISDADYVLLFEYGIDTGKTASTTDSGFALNAFTGRFESKRSTSTEIEYTKHLLLRLFASENFSGSSKPLWTCKANIQDDSSNLRKTIDYLLVGAFENFGGNSGGEMVLTISSEDERLKRINKALP
ncbi:MAG: hypothetical protein HY809_01595 [Nitrospirae bacterium]|nr:hypothetical protein [Nitrospirota bacterium]